MNAAEESPENPQVFLSALGDNLKGKDGVDRELAEILNTHILKTVPAQNAVSQARDAILKLAAERSKSLNPEAANG